MPERMTAEELIEGLDSFFDWINPRDEEQVLKDRSRMRDAIETRLREADRMEAWIRHTYGDWTDEPDREKPRPDKMISYQMAQRINGLIGERGFLYPEAEAIIARLEEADRMEKSLSIVWTEDYKIALEKLETAEARWQKLREWAEGADYPEGHSVTHEYDQQGILAKLDELEGK